MTITELVNYQKEQYSLIMGAANSIDPKLLGILSYEDIFDDKYLDPGLYAAYNDAVRPLINNYKTRFNDMYHQCRLEIVNNAALVLPNTGYRIGTGEETYTFSGSLPHDYIPCVELEGILEGIAELTYNNRFRTFWDRPVYTLVGNNESVEIYAYSTPTEFIHYARDRFTRSFGETNLQKTIRSVKIAETAFDYTIHVPSLTPYEDKTLTGKYEEAVRRHLILKELLENESTGGSVFSSKIDINGTVELTRLD